MEIIIIILLILMNGVFATAEIAIVTMRKLRLQHLTQKGQENAKIALELKENPNQFLSTIQIGITLVGILSGAFGGRTIANSLDKILIDVPILSAYHSSIALGIVVIAITFFTLVIGELVPKRIAMAYPEGISLLLARPMYLLFLITKPFVNLLSMSTDWVLRLLRVRKFKEDPITQDEIKILVQQATQAGVFEKVEQDIVERVLRLGDKSVEDIMTSRLEIVWLNVKDTPLKLKDQLLKETRSRYPVCNGTLDKVVGIVHVKELLYESILDSSFNLKNFVHEPLFVPEHLHVLKLLELFKESGSHLALALDEYGSIQGLVTLNDVMEEIVGDIPAIEDVNQPLIVKRMDDSYLSDGLLPIHEFKKTLGIDEKLPGEEKGTFHTLGGFVMSHFGKVPILGNVFEWDGLRFEIVDLDGKRIDKLLITRMEHKPELKPITEIEEA